MKRFLLVALLVERGSRCIDGKSAAHAETIYVRPILMRSDLQSVEKVPFNTFA